MPTTIAPATVSAVDSDAALSDSSMDCLAAFLLSCTDDDSVDSDEQ